MGLRRDRRPRQDLTRRLLRYLRGRDRPAGAGHRRRDGPGRQGEGAQAARRYGYDDAGWILLDFDSVLAHVFLPGERSYYDLESLWSTAAKRRKRAASA